ncbi:DUF3370 domain-containing protein [Cyanobacterium aponinum UTEX 3222]|uniref:DUF3370 domain-containing protein n=1 Tax=Cyanobacterium aponinum TaxID=379064 RepID=UPI00308C67BE|nr:DUF3370 domain-containing protein [Cyanobacterium aponinum UTEX 3222]
MLELISFFFNQPSPSILLAQNNTPAIVTEENNTIRPLTGELNQIPVFNSNSPELIVGEGILLSTFPPDNKNTPTAHLNYPLQGRFDIFAHHVAKAVDENDTRTLYLGIILQNPTNETVAINILQGASYLSQPDAPFIKLPSLVESSNTYAGPGSRVMGEILQEKRQDIFSAQITLKAGESKMLLNAPIPVQTLEPKINGRSTYMRLLSDGEVYVASLAMYRDEENNPPSLSQWQDLLNNGELSAPRDLAPTPPDATGKRIYGRVAGVSIGNQWKTDLVDSVNSTILTIPESGKAFSYGLSTLVGGTFGLNQVQTAPLTVRYPDTAYSAHGNYGVEYSLTLPLFNPSNESKTVNIALSTPLKQETPEINFFENPPNQVFFRGLVQVKYNDNQNVPRWRYFHLVQNRGQKGENLVTVTIPPQGQKLVSIDFLYPPDATPPQILTVETN